MWASEPQSPLLSARLVLVGLVSITIAAVSAAPTRAAEIRLLKECRCQNSVVTLGEVADVLTADQAQAERLAALELFPAPPSGERRFLEAREVQDLLLIRGMNLIDLQFSGASQVTILGPSPSEQASMVGDISDSVKGRARATVREAIIRYLRQHSSGDEPWDVEVTLADCDAQRLLDSQGELAVRGASLPRLGHQRFELTFATSDGSQQLAVDAHVTLPPAVVVAAVALPRGTTIHPQDVRLQRVDAVGPREEAIRSLEDVIGRETVRSIPAGNVIRRESIRQPLLVRRGGVITVRAQGAGIRVTTTATAREDGTLGDYVAVESVEGRKRFFVRVIGPQEAEVVTQSRRTTPLRTIEPSRLGMKSPLQDHRGEFQQPWSPEVRSGPAIGSEKPGFAASDGRWGLAGPYRQSGSAGHANRYPAAHTERFQR
jgi:flagella basal body P-ring formation protein FlgA